MCSYWAQQAHDAEDTYAEEILQRFRAALTTRLESNRLLRVLHHRETRIRAAAQVVFADVVDSRCAQQELIELLSWVSDRWCLRLSPDDVEEDRHGECSRAGSREARGGSGPLSVCSGSGTRQRPCSC